MKKLLTFLLFVTMVVCSLMFTACGASSGGHHHQFNIDNGYVDGNGIIYRQWNCDCGESKLYKAGKGYFVTPETAQDVLDGKYGPLSGKTIIFSAGEYGDLEFGRATSYEGGETVYCGTQNEILKDLEDISVMTWGSKYYTRSIKNLKVIANEGVSVASLSAFSGHVKGVGYDYVINKEFNGSGYFLSHQFENVTFKGINFTGRVDFSTSQGTSLFKDEVVLETTSIDGLNFIDCSFTTGGIESSNGAGLSIYSEMSGNNEVIKNVVVEKCNFVNSYQGIYTHHVNSVTVKNSTFDTTGHNAIAIQNHGDKTFGHGIIIIDNNMFNNIGDRIIRFNLLDAESITITNNVATNSGDDDLQVIKATSIEDGIEFVVNSNDWGEGRVVANAQFEDAE